MNKIPDEPPPPGMVPSCAEGGVLGVLCASIGSIQVTEAIKLLTKAQTFKHERKVRADIDYNLARAYDMENDKRAARRLWYRFYLRYRHTEKHRAQRAKRRYERLDKERQKGK